MALLAACSILQIDQEPSVAALEVQCQNAQSLAIVQAGGLRAALHGDSRCLSSFMAKRGIRAQCRTSRATTTRPAGVD
ncbi:FYVE-type domain-containing protein [Plasmodiophora brassicae]